MKHKRLSSAEFDLAQIRKLKRLTKRAYTGLVEMERHIMKMGRKAKATPAEVAAGLEFHRQASKLAGPKPHNAGGDPLECCSIKCGPHRIPCHHCEDPLV